MFDLGTFVTSRIDNNEKEERIWSCTEKRNWSDWVIIISLRSKTENEKNIDETTYYVHKSQLASGRRSSDYFKSIFNREDVNCDQLLTKENIQSTSIVEFDNQSSLRAFPVMLDFLYSNNEAITFSSDIATALRYLSNYFVVKELFDDVNNFIQGDMGPETVTQYFLESYYYNDEKLLEVSSNFIRDNFDLVGIDNIISVPAEILLSSVSLEIRNKIAENFAEAKLEDIMQLPPELMVAIFTSPSFSYECKKLSITVFEYLKTHNINDLEVIKALTSTNLMPHIHPECALSFMNLIEGMAEMKRTSLVLKSLFDRCLESITLNWKKVLTPHSETKNRHCTSRTHSASALLDEHDEFLSKYSNIPSDLMIKLLLCSLAQSQSDYEELTQTSQKKYDNLVELFQLLMVAAQKEQKIPK